MAERDKQYVINPMPCKTLKEIDNMVIKSLIYASKNSFSHSTIEHVSVMPCKARVKGSELLNQDAANSMSKPRTALIQEEENDESMANKNIHDRVIQNSYRPINNMDMRFSSFGERQSDMSDGVVYNITTNSTKSIFFGANMHKSIMEKTLFFKYGKNSVRN